MQLFFKKSLLFEKIIISLHLIEKSSGFATFLLLNLQPFQKSREQIIFAEMRACLS